MDESTIITQQIRNSSGRSKKPIYPARQRIIPPFLSGIGNQDETTDSRRSIALLRVFDGIRRGYLILQRLNYIVKGAKRGTIDMQTYLQGCYLPAKEAAIPNSTVTAINHGK
jgi:hypothetical protein